MKNRKQIIPILIILIMSHVYGQSGWFMQTSGVNNALKSIYFTDTSNGWIAGSSGLILRTTNGGSDWFNQTSGTNVELRSIFFVDNNFGWAVGQVDTILKTSNGGTNWIKQPVGITPLFLSHIRFFNNLTGYILGNSWGGIICKTTNGGINWQTFTSASVWTSGSFLNENTGWVVGYDGINGGQLLKTETGGNSWSTEPGPLGGLPLNGISMINSNSGWLVGNGGVMAYRQNNGTWFKLFPSLTTSHLKSIIFIGSIGYIVGYDSKILKTINGTDWQFLNSGISGNYNSVYFINLTTGWIAGENGIVLKTINGGEPIGIQIISSEIPKRFSMSQNYPNPFNPVTNINFDIVKNRHVKLTIFDVLGHEVATIVNQELQAGSYKADWNATKYPSGIYLYRFETNDFVDTKKMILLK